VVVVKIIKIQKSNSKVRFYTDEKLTFLTRAWHLTVFFFVFFHISEFIFLISEVC